MIVVGLFSLMAAAWLEIHGDRRIGSGVLDRDALRALSGFGLLAAYGVAVNIYNWFAGPKLSFDRLLGLYIACFAIMNVIIAWPKVARLTCLGTAVIAAGGLIILYGVLTTPGAP